MISSGESCLASNWMACRLRFDLKFVSICGFFITKLNDKNNDVDCDYRNMLLVVIIDEARCK